MKPVQIFKCKDKKENYYKKKADLFDLPMRILCVGKSQYSGKSSWLLNMLEQDDDRLYKAEYDGGDMYIFSESLTSDTKIKNIIKQHDIPHSNTFEGYDENALDAIFDMVQDDYNDAINNNKKPKHSLIILDDCSFGGDLRKKNNSTLNKIFCNGRHINLSVICTAQKYTQLHNTQRENATGVVLWDCSDKQLDLIAEDHNILESKKEFKKMFRTVTHEPFSHMIVNYSNPRDRRYMNMNFEPIKKCGHSQDGNCDC